MHRPEKCIAIVGEHVEKENMFFHEDLSLITDISFKISAFISITFVSSLTHLLFHYFNIGYLNNK